jgi:hypothetical protein
MAIHVVENEVTNLKGCQLRAWSGGPRYFNPFMGSPTERVRIHPLCLVDAAYEIWIRRLGPFHVTVVS